MSANTGFPDHTQLNIPKVLTAAPTDRRLLIRTTHLPTLQPDLPPSIPKVPLIVVEEEGLVVSEEISSVQVGEDIEAALRIRNGTLVLVAEGVNTHQL
jgi:hypothetical protein